MVSRPISNPPNPWLSSHVEYLEEIPPARLEVYEDHTRAILATNDSPDVGFAWSVNPYRGCFHACAYCYARPTHEYLGLGAGTDFDRKITVKPEAAGLAVGVMVAPVIPGLGDADIPAILEAAARAGAKSAGFVFLRLPGSVAAVFEERLREKLPLRAERVLARVREARGGKLYDSRFGIRGRGAGTYAETCRELFESTARRVGIATSFTSAEPERATFRRPDRP